jgi:uncharacterized protein YciI
MRAQSTENISAFAVVTMLTRYASLEQVQAEAPETLAAHIQRTRQFHESGRLVMAGAFIDRPEQNISTMAVLITPTDAQEFADGDPFVLAEMVISQDIRQWGNILARQQG